MENMKGTEREEQGKNASAVVGKRPSFFLCLQLIVINQALELYLEENMSLTSHGAEIHGMIFCFRMFCLSGFI